jgi:O-methyltransferase
MSMLVDSARYVFRYTLTKFDAFQAFGAAGRTGAGHLPHSVVYPLATYSPWITDTAFQRFYKEIKGSTLVDPYRCYELWSLARESAKLPSGDFIEVGVWRGGTGSLIAAQANRCVDGAVTYLCDTFTGVAKAGASDRHYKGREHADTSKEAVLALARRLELHRIEVLEGVFPDESGIFVADKRFRFCHIDVDVYQSGLDVLEFVWPRMVRGGMVVFDDYGSLSTGGITQLVNEQRVEADRLMLHNLNGHAIFVKL